MACMSFFAQLSGVSLGLIYTSQQLLTTTIQNSVLTYYLPSMYTKLGITSTDRRLLLTFANSIVSCTGAVFGSATNDMIGRRTKLWVGSIVLACLFAAVTGFSSQFEGGADNVDAPMSNAGVAFIFLFGCAYSFVYTPLTATYCAEVLANHTRAKGMGVVSPIRKSCSTISANEFTATACDHEQLCQSVQHLCYSYRS